ncbi:Hypothetical predicted protein [Mytilus galloprovincialis]|uniref:Fibronectin type-III domain-containing protein n=1 Tax=Mytilus galloprovincialis TaxID=29158 RepID=A0A8B6FD82_MYTGA|nr:Hypothetical predicted protein [Mytilus galloprovincialis]
MDDNSIKVLSWIGISMVITYRSFFLDSTIGISQIFYPRRKPCYDISELIRKNIKILTVSITEDTDFLITWIKRVEQTSIIWKTGETKPLPESIKFQMVSVNGNSEVAYQIMVLPKHSPDKEACIKQIKGNEENMTDCDEEENNTLTEWLSQYKETIIQSIRKDAMTFIEILKGDSKFLDENIRKDIDSLTRTPRLSCKGMCRYYYTIILTKTTSNKGTSTEYILHDNETPPECILEDKETMTEGSLQDKETMTEDSLQDKETMTQGSIQDEETMTASTKHMRALFEPGCPSALNITSTKVELKWEEPSIGTDFIHFYQIFCEEQSSSRTRLFETPKLACNCVVEGLKPNAEYAFKIQAIKNGGNKGTISQTLTISTLEISCDRMAELVYVSFYFAVLIWFTFILTYLRSKHIPHLGLY